MTSSIWVKYLIAAWVMVTAIDVTWAQSTASLSGISLSADEMSRDSVKQIITLNGNVQIVFSQNYLSADSAVVYLATKEIEAKGQVVLKSPTIHAEATGLRFNYETQLGRLYNGFVQSGQVVFEGDVVEKVGEKQFVATRGIYTACNTCPPAWSFSGHEISAEVGGYADIMYPVFRIGGYPFLILPRIIVPLKSARQSGLLVPTLEFGSESGFALGMSHFWAISRSQDMTNTLKYYNKRGVKYLGEYRYVLSPQSHGTLRGAILNDSLFSDPNDPTIDKPTRRGFLDYTHYFVLPEDYVQRTEVKHVSDLHYPRDFSEELPGNGEAALENRFSLTKNTENQHISVDTGIYINLLESTAFADTQNSVHRFPQIRYTLKEQRLLDWPLLASLNFESTSFIRNGLSYDDVTGSGANKSIAQNRDGVFDPDNDVIRTGHRLDISPTLSLPLQLGHAIDLTPSMKYREMQYRFGPESTDDYNNTAAQRYLEANVSLRTQFHKIFGATDSVKGTRYKHQFEPEIQYSVIPWIERADHPFFGDFENQPYIRSFEPVSDQDFFTNVNKIQFDYNDRIYRKRLVNFVLTNKLISKKFVGNSADYQTIATFRISQFYDLDADRLAEPRPLSPVNSLLMLRLSRFETYTTVTYFPYTNLSNSTSRLRWIIDDIGNYLETTHSKSYAFREDFSSVNEEGSSESIKIGAGIKSKYINLHGEIAWSQNPAIEDEWALQRWEYIATIKPPGNCWGIELGHRQDLASKDVKFKFNFNFEFGGI